MLYSGKYFSRPLFMYSTTHTKNDKLQINTTERQIIINFYFNPALNVYMCVNNMLAFVKFTHTHTHTHIPTPVTHLRGLITEALWILVLVHTLHE